MKATLVPRGGFAVQIGRAHQAGGLPCQDAARLRRIRRSGFVTAVADGAGSARYAADGARVAVKAAVEALEKNPRAVLAQADHRYVLDHVRERMAARAAEIGCDLRQLASTLMAVLAHKSAEGVDWLAFHVGDGVIAADFGTGPEVLSRPENGEFGNSTYFVTDASAHDHFRVYRGSAPWSAFALMTDGAAECLYQRSTRKLAGAVGTMFDWSRSLDARRFTKALEQNLASVIAPRTTDDATLSVVCLGPRMGTVKDVPPRASAVHTGVGP
ncbi:PP2C family serine/threonine-protein phosphatase (plasmid) [Azospirillum sp. A29]|uniref:PP2C family serine/threonine-protein phosphatase n=1 Tax=Azospirillum sp. A29 TaxID=3160606 RepID=UPI00366B35FA